MLVHVGMKVCIYMSLILIKSVLMKINSNPDKRRVWEYFEGGCGDFVWSIGFQSKITAMQRIEQPWPRHVL